MERLKFKRRKIICVSMLLNLALICHVGSFEIQEETTINRTKLVSYFVLTCGSSAGLCNQSFSPFHIVPARIPRCAEWLSCEPRCALDKTCAPDATMAYVTVSCISTVIYPLEEGHKYDAYNMIAQCKMSQTITSSVNEFCSDLPKRSMANLHDDIFKPVISKSSLMIYRNIYCASCNDDDTDIITFKLEVTCPYVFDINSFSNLQDVWNSIYLNNCSVYYKPPEEYYVSACLKENDVDRCNATGLWSTADFDPHIEWACENFNSYSYEGYKNIYCYMCNPSFAAAYNTKLISSCNITGEYSNTDIIVEQGCYTLPSAPSTAPFKNIFCKFCNVIDDEQEFDVDDCFGCVFTPILRDIFSFSPPNLFNAPNLIDKEPSEYCALGKTLVNDICQPLIGSTVYLDYEITFGFRISHSDVEFNISVFDLLECFRQQVIDQLLSESFDTMRFSSVTVSSSKSCTDVVQLKSLKDDQKNIKGNGFLFEAHLFVGKTRNRSRLENYLDDSRNNRSFSISVENRNVIVNSYQHDVAPACINISHVGQSEGCSSSKYDTPGHVLNSDTNTGIWIIPGYEVPLKINILLSCVLKTLRNVDESLIENLCSSDILFDYNSDTKSVRLCRSDLTQITLNPGNATLHSPVMDTLTLSHGIFSFACTCVSLLCLLLTFLTYVLLKAIRTIPGINNMNLVLTLFGAQIFTQFGLWQIGHRGICIILGIVTHYFWLSTFCAMNICSFHMFRAFASLKYSLHQEIKWTVLKYCLYIYVAPILAILFYVIIKVSVDGTENLGYGGSMCFLSEVMPIITLLIIPAGVIIIINAVFFAIACWHIRSIPHVRSTADRNELQIYVKLLTVTGVSWSLIFIDALLPLSVFSFVATFANALQGVFIFLAFICNKKVLYLFRIHCSKQHIYSSAEDTRKINTKETTM